MNNQVCGVAAVLSLALLPVFCPAQEKVSPFASFLTTTQKNKGDFQLANSKMAAPIYLDANDFPVARIAADALAGDIQSVTNTRPMVSSTVPMAGGSAVFVGTLGKSRLIDELVAKNEAFSLANFGFIKPQQDVFKNSAERQNPLLTPEENLLHPIARALGPNAPTKGTRYVALRTPLQPHARRYEAPLRTRSIQTCPNQ